MVGTFVCKGLKSALRCVVVAGLAVAATPAVAYPPQVEDACKDDYFRFCALYPLNSTSLRLCMEAKAKEISQNCARALIDAGYVDRRRWKR